MADENPSRSLIKGGQRLEFLDTLRGLAAVYVVIYHMLHFPRPVLDAPRWASLVANDGGTGVSLFFVASAFSLFYTMPLRSRDKNPWLSFFLHRFFRIAPLFYAWIVFSMLRDYWTVSRTFPAAEVLSSAAFVFNLIPDWQPGIVWASWTIGVEMVFYAIFPAVFVVARDKWRAVALFLGLLLIWTIVQGLASYVSANEVAREEYLHWSFMRYFPTFACGAVAFHVLMPYLADPARTRSDDHHGLGAALVMSFCVGFAALLNGWLPDPFGNIYYWQGVLYGVLVVGLGLWPLRAVVNRVTGYLGRISYSMYLNHPTVVFFLAPVYARLYGDGRNLTIAFLSSLALTLAVLIPLSELTYRLIELPGIRLGKRVQGRLSPRRAIMPAGGVQANSATL